MTPQEYLEALWACTGEWCRALKPTGSLWVNLADKYGRGSRTTSEPQNNVRTGSVPPRIVPTGHDKSLMGMPWRYALGCIYDLGLILRRDQIWQKGNPIPESVPDRTHTAHEYWFHLVKQPKYYSALDELREEQQSAGERHVGRSGWVGAPNGVARSYGERALNPLGKLPGSVWRIASEPLSVPDYIAHARCCKGRKRGGCEDGLNHFAAFPSEWPKRLITAFSPPGICTECGQGRWPVVSRERQVYYGAGRHRSGAQQVKDGAAAVGWKHDEKWNTKATIIGYACACTPHTDHPERRGKDFHGGDPDRGRNDGMGGERSRRYRDELANPRGPVREYHVDAWTPPPTRPAVVVDPMGGTGTTALVAKALGRIGVTVDRSHDYGRLARWRTTDREQLAKVLDVPKPPKPMKGQTDLFGEIA